MAKAKAKAKAKDDKLKPEMGFLKNPHIYFMIERSKNKNVVVYEGYFKVTCVCVCACVCVCVCVCVHVCMCHVSTNLTHSGSSSV